MKPLKTIIIAALAIMPVLYTSCKKDEKSQKADGMMMNLGEPAADGCGWVIRINQVDYSPTILDDKFKQDSLPVKVTYQLLEGRYQCGLAANIGLSQIKLKSISKR